MVRNLYRKMQIFLYTCPLDWTDCSAVQTTVASSSPSFDKANCEDIV